MKTLFYANTLYDEYIFARTIKYVQYNFGTVKKSTQMGTIPEKNGGVLEMAVDCSMFTL